MTSYFTTPKEHPLSPFIKDWAERIVRPVSPFIKDWAERIVRTFLAAALAIVATNLASVTDLDGAKTLGAAAVTAGVTAVIGLVTRFVGNPNTSSVFRPAQGQE